MCPPPRLQNVPERLHLLSLRVYRRLPTWARRRAVRTIAPSHTVGAICVIVRGDASILLAHYQRGESLAEISGRLGRSRDALKQVMLRIRRVLRTCIERQLVGQLPP